MNALGAQLVARAGLPSLGRRLSPAMAGLGLLQRQTHTASPAAMELASLLNGKARSLRSRRLLRGGVVAAKGGRWEKEREELRREKEGAAPGAASKKAAGFGKPAPAQTRPPKLLDILVYPDPRLRAENKPVTAFDAALQQLAKDMFHTMYRTEGIGLAAPQVGVNVRMMVFNEAGVEGQGREVVLLNPRIVRFSNETDFFEEGCLSFPLIYADVKRPLGCVVEFEDLQGKTVQLELTGLEARVFQHEYDHLQGVLFHDRMAPPALGTVAAALAKLEAEGAKKGWAVIPPPPGSGPFP